MNKLYAIAGAAALAGSSAVVVPVLMLIAVLTAVTALVVALDHREPRNGFVKTINSSEHRKTS
jgi:hypothetical protein